MVLPPESGPVNAFNFSTSAVRTGSGTWDLHEETATMTNPNALWAKLILPMGDKSSPSSYEFEARSTGSGKVGFGMHIHGRGEWELRHYGGGDSILVWITSDPKVYGDAGARIQIYRSRTEVDMPMIASTAIAVSPFEYHTYRIDYDTLTGQLAVSVDDTRVMSIDGLENWSRFGYTALRAMDTAEFRKVKTTSLNPGSLSRGDQQ
jgi:hypothetical protein